MTSPVPGHLTMTGCPAYEEKAADPSIFPEHEQEFFTITCQHRGCSTRRRIQMRVLTGFKGLLLFSFVVLGLSAHSASATCAQDISKVEYAIDHAKRTGIDITVAEKMRALLEDANKERKSGNEQKCQELIDQAKYIGNVE